jgi:septal ring factor EnvC (AmiA/AmiB activator)
MAFTKLILIFCISFSTALAASTLAKSRGEILQLGARLNALEKNLGQHNNKYLAAIERIRVFETDVVTYQQRLTEVKTETIKREQEMATILRSHALAMVEDEIVPDVAYKKLAEENRAKAFAATREAEALEKILAEFNERLVVLRTDEQELLKLSQDLEAKKRQMTEVYLAKLEERQKLETREQKQKITTRLSAVKRAEVTGQHIPASLKFRSPVLAWNEVISSDKGITYKLGKMQPIAAPREGRVAYNGELASYGKVLMIDHGDDIRTVMLGRFTSNLEKNALVKLGDIVGNTEGVADSLYFEVRKKNVAQKTIHWMEPAATGKI